jgi:hypothetical protein
MQWVLPLYQNWSSSSSQSAHSWLKFDTGPEEGLVFAVWQASLADKWGFLNPEEQLGTYALNHSTSLFGMGFFDMGLVNYLPRLALNYDSPDLCLLSSYDYRHVPPVPHPAGGSFYYFFLCPFLIFPFSLTPSFCFLYDYVFLIKIFEKHCKSNVII